MQRVRKRGCNKEAVVALMIDTSKLKTYPISQRESRFFAKDILTLSYEGPVHPKLIYIAKRIKESKRDGKHVIFMMGAHVIRSGVQLFIIDMMRQGYISLIAMNGAGLIHDYEMARFGSCCEDVERYVKEGRFGMWDEIGQITSGMFPTMVRAESLVHCAIIYNIPVTLHIGIGYDIVCQHPSYNPEAWARKSYNDFLTFAEYMMNPGVVMNFGSAVMAPEIYLKGLNMARNVTGKPLDDHATLVCDLIPEKDLYYYYRPGKTMLERTTGDGHYVCGDHKKTIPQLWKALQ